MIESREDLRAYIAADLATHGIDRWRWWVHFTHHIAAYQWTLRHAEFAANRPRSRFNHLVARAWYLRLRHLGVRYGFEIPLNAFGPGLSIAHRGAIVVNRSVRVGRDCRIHQGVTIGQWKGQNPVIGDRVTIGVNSCIIGGVHVGDDVLIGTNVSVVKDVPAGATVVGAVAQLLQRATA